jgi:predicted transcriptional regulator
LAQLASQQGRDSESLVVDAVERMVNYDQWLLREVEKGIFAADRGELVDHEDIQKLIDRRYPGSGRDPRPATLPKSVITSRNMGASL